MYSTKSDQSGYKFLRQTGAGYINLLPWFYPFAGEFWKLRRPCSCGVVYTALGKADTGSAPWHTLPNLRNEGRQLDQLDSYILY